MDLERMLAMLSAKCLYFGRLDTLKDPWESVWPGVIAEAIKKSMAAGNCDSLLEYGRRNIYVNCWHVSEHQSAALWEQYSRSAGFAIRSTVGAIKRAIAPTTRYLIGEIKYVDYDGDFPLSNGITVFDPAVLKRKSFEHEREVRIILCPSVLIKETAVHPPRDGIEVPVDLKSLIEEILLSPIAPRWLQPHVEAMFTAFGLASIRVKPSDLYDSHIY